MHNFIFFAEEKIKDHQNKCAKSGHSHTQTNYNNGGKKAEINAMVQQSIKSTIALFVKKAKVANKRKAEWKMNKNDEELYYLIPTGSISSAISVMEDIPVNALNIGLWSNKYGAGIAKLIAKIQIVLKI